MMKTIGKKRYAAGSIVAAGVAALVAMGIATSAGAQMTLKYSDHDPPGGMRTGFNKAFWLPEIEKQTGGEVEVQDFFGGALFSSKEILKGIGDGVADMGFVYPGHYPQQLLVHNVFALFPRGPGKFENIAWLWKTAMSEIPAFQEEQKRANVKIIMVTAGLPGAFAGKKPIKRLADIRGDRWRAGDKWLLRYLGNAGAQPVAVPWGDTYMALQTGTIDGVYTNYDGLHMMKFDEVASNLLVSKSLWFAIPLVHMMNAEKFDSLPKDVQDGIMRAGELAEAEFAGVYEAAFDKVRDAQIAAGYQVSELSPEDIVTWENREELGKLQAQWVADAREAGLDNAEEVMAQVAAVHQRALAR